MKNFELLCYVYSESIVCQVANNTLQIGFKVDSKEHCNVRVSLCVTEQVNEMNVPIMFYTPNQADYVKILNM